MHYMLDTNICIHLIQRHPPQLLHRLQELNYGDLAIKREAKRALDALLAYLPVLPLDNAAAVQYGVLAAAVRDRRRDALDRLIAAHAASLGLTLVTNNEADFRDYPGLVVENWI